MINILMNLFEIGINLFEGLLMSSYVYYALGDKENRSFIKSGGLIFGIAVAAAITFVSNLKIFDNLFIIIYIAILFVYSLFRLKGEVSKKLFISSFSILYPGTISLLFVNLYTTLFQKQVNDVFEDGPFARIAIVSVCNLFIFFAYKITLKIFSRESKNNLNNYEWILILSVFLISMFVLNLNTYTAMYEIPYTARWLIVLSTLGIFAVDVVTIYIVVILSRKNTAIRETQLLRIQQKYQQQYLENAENQYEIIRKLRHDFKNHNIVISSLLESGDFDKAKHFVGDYLDRISVSYSVVNTDNNIVNAIINCKAEVANGLNIETSIVTVSDFCGIDDLDLCSLISNMFDNAIDACRKVKENRQIYFSIKKDDSHYVFCMKNSITDSVIKNNPDLVTTKKDKHLHGLGTKIIKDIAKKYNGMADFFEKDDFFICYVILKY